MVWGWRFTQLLGAIALAFAPQPLIAEEPQAAALSGGNVHFVPTAEEAERPERFRLEEAEFAWRAEPIRSGSRKLEIFEITFPSPIATDCAANNTVHCEYYRPLSGEEPGPAVIVLHILGGDFQLARVFCNLMAQRGTAALLLKMPYYGPRREGCEGRRMVAADAEDAVAGMTQAVLDIRRAATWLAERPEVDGEQLGVMGISMGGITAALAAGVEPRLKNVCLLLAGGDLARLAAESTELEDERQRWVREGRSTEDFGERMAPVDPLTYAANLRGRRVLMLNARDDTVVPRGCAESLWKAAGEPEIEWFPGGHYDLARNLFTALERVGTFYAPRE